MADRRTTNLLGALVTALHDEFAAATEAAATHGAAFPAALVSIHWQPGLSIEALRRILGLTHSGTVRLLDRLEGDGAIERRTGRDGRTVALALTPAGRAQARQVLAGRQQVLNKALALLSRAEQGQLLQLIEKLLGGLTRDRSHSEHICRLCDEPSCPQERCPVGCAVQEDGTGA
jgi:DNA-binding MarR family transcriptional regulator